MPIPIDSPETPAPDGREEPDMTGTASRAVAGCFALAAFTVAVVAGLAGGNNAVLILGRALVAMIVCYPLGLAVGLVCRQVIQQHLRKPEGTADEQEVAVRAGQSVESEEDAEDVVVV